MPGLPRKGSIQCTYRVMVVGRMYYTLHVLFDMQPASAARGVRAAASPTPFAPHSNPVVPATDQPKIHLLR